MYSNLTKYFVFHVSETPEPSVSEVTKPQTSMPRPPPRPANIIPHKMSSMRKQAAASESSAPSASQPSSQQKAHPPISRYVPFKRGPLQQKAATSSSLALAPAAAGGAGQGSGQQAADADDEDSSSSSSDSSSDSSSSSSSSGNTCTTYGYAYNIHVCLKQEADISGNQSVCKS